MNLIFFFCFIYQSTAAAQWMAIKCISEVRSYRK